MNEMSLSALYRRLVSARPPVAIDAQALADTLANAASPEQRTAIIAELAVSPAQADLARLLHGLQADSQALANEVNRVRRADHPQRQRFLRQATAARRAPASTLRWVSGIAACVAVVFGLSTWHADQRARHASDMAAINAVEAAAAKPDRIFTSQDRIFASSSADQTRSHRSGDRLFHADFSHGG